MRPASAAQRAAARPRARAGAGRAPPGRCATARGVQQARRLARARAQRALDRRCARPRPGASAASAACGAYRRSEASRWRRASSAARMPGAASMATWARLPTRSSRSSGGRAAASCEARRSGRAAPGCRPPGVGSWRRRLLLLLVQPAVRRASCRPVRCDEALGRAVVERVALAVGARGRGRRGRRRARGRRPRTCPCRGARRTSPVTVLLRSSMKAWSASRRGGTRGRCRSSRRTSGRARPSRVAQVARR